MVGKLPGPHKIKAQLCFLILPLALVGCAAGSLQVADLEFQPHIESPAFLPGEGPVVLIDEAHFNFHTAQGRYKPFAELLRRDGYVVRSLVSQFTAESLAVAEILVISNAVNEDDTEELPTASAFEAFEVTAVEMWIEQGGALLLIADHMPWPGAAEELAARFGLLFINGYALDAETGAGGMTFRRSDGSLRSHAITNGRRPEERIESVRTFVGQAFRSNPGTSIEPLLVLRDGTEVVLPEVAGQFSEGTPRVAAVGWLQGAVLRHGSGRVAAFGEAAMFSAQVSGSGEQRFLMGMNNPNASENPQFLLNVMHWLSGRLDESGGGRQP